MTTDLVKHPIYSSKYDFVQPFDFGRTEKPAKEPQPPSQPKVSVHERLGLDLTLLEEFATETSAHGCNHCASHTRSSFSRGLWTLAVASTLASMIYTLYSMLATYGDYPVNTLVKASVKQSLPFPGVTLCNINDVDISKISLDATLFRNVKSDLTFGLNITDRDDPDVRAILDTPIDAVVVNGSWINFGEFIILCYIHEVVVDCSDIFVFIQNSRKRCAALNTEHPSLKSMEYAGPISGLRMYLNLHQEGYVMSDSVAAGVQLYVHQPGHLPDFQNSGILLSPGFTNYVGTRQVTYKFLPPPYKAYGDETCVDLTNPSDPLYPGPLRLSSEYSTAACNLQCTLDSVSEFCGCRGVLNSENSTLPMCTVEQFYLCYNSAMTRVYFNVSGDNKCGCPRPCQHIEYRTQISSAYFPSEVATATLQLLEILPQDGVRENYMELRVFLSSLQVDEVLHEPVYTYLSVMGTIGGQMGFFLGASVLTLAELAELCFFYFLRLFRRISGAKKHISPIQVKPMESRHCGLNSDACVKDRDKIATLNWLHVFRNRPRE